MEKKTRNRENLQAKSWCFENICKICKPFQDYQPIIEREKNYSIRNEKESMSPESLTIFFYVIKGYYEQSLIGTFDNLNDMKSLELTIYQNCYTKN